MTTKGDKAFSLEGVLLGAFLPIIGFVRALIKPQSKETRTLIVMFFIFIGFCTLYKGSPGIDTNRVVEQFLIACKLGDVSLWSFYKLQPEANKVDFYLTTLSWLCSRFFSNPHLYLGVVVGIMAMFLTANCSFVYKRYYTKGVGHLLLVLLLLIPQAVYYPHRWWMAMQVFLFGALPIVYDNSKKRIVFCFLSILVHFSYIYLCALLIAYIFLPKKPTIIYLVFFYASLMMASFDFGSIVPYLEGVSDIQAIDRTTRYMHEIEVENNFLYKSAKLFFNVTKGILVFLIYRESDWIDKNRRMFCFTMLFTSFAHFASLNAVGYRFIDFGNFVMVIFLIYYLASNKASNVVVKWFKYLSPVFAYYIIYQVRGILDCISFQDLIVGNFITVWFTDDDTSVLTYIKDLL